VNGGPRDAGPPRGRRARPLAIDKGQALGNDYLVVRAEGLAAALGAAPAGPGGHDPALPGPGVRGPAPGADGPADPMTPVLARALCDRHRGLGGDGVLVGWPDRSPIRLRIWNPDGTPAEKSGNGLRIFGAWLHRAGVVGEDPFDVELPRDTVTMRVIGEAGGGALDLEVALGRADFRGSAAGFGARDDVVDEEPLDLGAAGEARVNTVSLGNPHCVVLVDAFERADFAARGPALATHAAFARGTNVQFARARDRRTAEAWIWERGAGETLASGSSACAVAATLVRKGLLDAGAVTVRMPGGAVGVDVADDYALTLRGPAQIVYEARVPASVLSAWSAPVRS